MTTRRIRVARIVRADRGSQVVAELLRLGVVLLLTAGGYATGGLADDLFGLGTADTTRLVTSVLGALFGYLLGGVVGRALVRSVDTATSRLESVPASRLVAAGLGAALGALVGTALLLPALLLPFQRTTIPVALLVVLALAYAGGRLGAVRGADLARFIGLRGRLDVRAPSRGAGVKVVDSSALIDGRIIDVARAGFLEGTLVVPTFVLREVQAIADADERHRRQLGKRGLATVSTLQDEALLVVEVDDGVVGEIEDVDARLVAVCRARQAALLTCDANLARVAEIGGVRVLNPHALADAVRSPVLPGERLELALVRPGREPDQGVGYLQDGTMVVVEAGAQRVGSTLAVDVTSIVQSRTGRLLFATPAHSDVRSGG